VALASNPAAMISVRRITARPHLTFTNDDEREWRIEFFDIAIFTP
jgi:hypothetical protein